MLDLSPSHAEWQQRLQWKPYTLARFGILPALEATADFDSSHLSPREFFLSTLASWGADSLKGAVGNTVSKKKWDEEVQEHLRLQREREQYEQQRAPINGHHRESDTTRTSIQIPQERPDCLDDVVSFCTALCAVGPDFAAQFCDERDNTLVLSRAVRELESQQASDVSLRPCFLSLMGALASAVPDAVYQMQNWDEFVTTIWKCVQFLNPRNDLRTDSSQSTAPQSSSQYYYFGDSGLAASNNRGTELSSNSFASGLGEADTLSLLSYLFVITMVAKHSVSARVSLIALKAPLLNSQDPLDKGSLVGLLLTLSVQAVTPTIRGAIFSVVANLLRIDDCTDHSQLALLRDQGRKAWNQVEESQILPICHLEQYPSDPHQTQIGGLAFPPSSTDAVSLF